MRPIKESMKSIKDEKGAAGLEFTLLFPFLLFVTFGIIEFGALMFNQAIFTNAAREGARVAIVYTHNDPDNAPSCADFGVIRGNARAAVMQYLQDADGNWFPINDPDFRPIEDDDIPVSIELEDDTGEYTLSVQVNYDYQFIFINSIVNFLLNGTAGTSLQLNAKAEMRGEDNYVDPLDDTTKPLVEVLGPLNCG